MAFARSPAPWLAMALRSGDGRYRLASVVFVLQWKGEGGTLEMTDGAMSETVSRGELQGGISNVNPCSLLRVLGSSLL